MTGRIRQLVVNFAFYSFWPSLVPEEVVAYCALCVDVKSTLLSTYQ